MNYRVFRELIIESTGLPMGEAVKFLNTVLTGEEEEHLIKLIEEDKLEELKTSVINKIQEASIANPNKFKSISAMK